MPSKKVIKETIQTPEKEMVTEQVTEQTSKKKRTFKVQDTFEYIQKDSSYGNIVNRENGQILLQIQDKKDLNLIHVAFEKRNYRLHIKRYA